MKTNSAATGVLEIEEKVSFSLQVLWKVTQCQ